MVAGPLDFRPFRVHVVLKPHTLNPTETHQALIRALRESPRQNLFGAHLFP